MNSQPIRVDLKATVTFLGPYAAYKEGTDELVCYCQRDGTVVCWSTGYVEVGRPLLVEVVSVDESAWK